MPVEVIDETAPEAQPLLPDGASTRDAAAGDTAMLDTATRDTATLDTATRDTATRDTLTRDAPTRDAAEGDAPVGSVSTGGASEAPRSLGEAVQAIAEAILEIVGRADAELSVALVGDERMRELNRDWRGRDSTTDVLSFSQLEGEPVAGMSPMLGDVVISVPVLERQAADGGWTVGEELARLLLHGVLHLLGHDHEDDEDAHVMRAEEGRVIAALAARGIACAWEGETA